MRKMMLLSLVILFACKKAELPVAADALSATATTTPPARNAAKKEAAVAAPLDRMIIRNATISLIVHETQKAIDAIWSAVEGAGGDVSSSNTWRENDVLRGKLSLRVPNGRLTTALASIRSSAIRVQSESV